MELTALTKKEVSDVIHGRKKAPRVPVALHFWTHAEDFPDPETPAMPTILLSGISTSIFFRLCTRAPRTLMQSTISAP